MSSDTKTSVSRSSETELTLLPHMPFLLQDLWALGCSVDEILEAVGSLGLRAETAGVLDLGCGKGALSVRLAAEYGFPVLGIDAMVPFLDAARSKVKEYRVSHLCRFQEGDILEFVSVDHEYDLVLYASLDGILGSLESTVSRLRRQVQTGGTMIIDDGYLKHQNRLDRKGFEHYRDHENTIRELTVFGDQLLCEVNTAEAHAKINREYLEALSRRAGELALEHPGLKPEIEAFVTLQREECQVLKEQVEGALWVLKKGTTP
jgi:ubiquinone/menaquinone biosynthesis C-methylase UbiE